jgi:hypothetical protein
VPASLPSRVAPVRARVLRGPQLDRRALLGGRPGVEEGARHPAKEPRQDHRRDLRDGRVVPADLVVVELAPVGDLLLEPLDLTLEAQDVLLRAYPPPK